MDNASSEGRIDVFAPRGSGFRSLPVMSDVSRSRFRVSAAAAIERTRFVAVYVGHTRGERLAADGHPRGLSDRFLPRPVRQNTRRGMGSRGFPRRPSRGRGWRSGHVFYLSVTYTYIK